MTLTAEKTILETARAFVPAIKDQAADAERNRRVSPELVRDMAAQGLFNILVPRSLGGSEVDVATMIRVFETLGAADGSAGWVVMIGATTGIVSAYMDEDAAREIYKPGTITGGVVAPKGKVTPVEGGYRVSGRWPFASGCQHSDWLLATSLVFDDSGLVTSPSGEPIMRQPMLPASEVEIIDTWHVAGLRATGSHDMAIRDVFVPDKYCVSIMSPSPQPGLLYAFPVFGILAIAVAAVALGIARAALDEITALASRKASAFNAKPLALRGPTQDQLARGEAEQRSARAFLLETVEETCDSIAAGNAVSGEQRALLRLAATNATHSSARAVDIAYSLGGGASIYEDSPLQRQFRDIHVATQHIGTSPQTYEMAGGVLLGAASPNPML